MNVPFMPSHTFLYGGQARIRTLEADGSRFTVCPLCPLGYLPFQQLKRLAVPSCINNTLRERGKRGYKTKPNFSCRNRQKRASQVFPFKNRKGRPHQTEYYIETLGTRQETKSKAQAQYRDGSPFPVERVLPLGDSTGSRNSRRRCPWLTGFFESP